MISTALLLCAFLAYALIYMKTMVISTTTFWPGRRRTRHRYQERHGERGPGLVLARRQRVAEVLDDLHGLGVGDDISDPEVMARARR